MTTTACTRCDSRMTYRDTEGDLCCVRCGFVAVQAIPEEWRGIRREPRRMPERKKVGL